ncbi:MAG TPA: hypothetical protein VNL91_03365 [Thermoanaerobaculia bacterium]|nr:hypothetical protein [Thermoanaerobaculia bacterium]
MRRIKVISADEARGLRRHVAWFAKKLYGYLPGVHHALPPDLAIGTFAGILQDASRLPLAFRATRFRFRRGCGRRGTMDARPSPSLPPRPREARPDR